MIEKLLKERILVLDGAMGTMIQEYELEESDFRGDFLLTHSSLIQILIYFGIIGLIVLFYEFYKILKKRNKYNNNLIMFTPFLFLVINLLKSDSLFYFSTLFTLLFFYTVNKSSYKI